MGVLIKNTLYHVSWILEEFHCRYKNLPELQENIYVDRMVNTLKTKCSNENCPWQGDLLDLVQAHRLNCDYIKEACKNEGCDVTMLKKDIIHHENECFYQLIRCNYCQIDVTIQKKKDHEVVCSMEIIECQYHDVGCTVKFCRKDSESHQTKKQVLHMSLIHKSHAIQLSKCKEELSKSNSEILFLKRENNDLKATAVLEISQLKEQLKKMQNRNISKAHYLTEKLNKVPQFRETVIVEYINGALYTQYICHCGFIEVDELSTCFESNSFGTVLEYLQFREQKILMGELFNETTYHMYEITEDYFMFCFSIDLNNLKDFHLKLRDIFIVKLEKNEFTVETLQRTRGTNVELFIGKYCIKLQDGKKFNLLHVNGSMLSEFAKPFANGYACLRSLNPRYS